MPLRAAAAVALLLLAAAPLRAQTDRRTEDYRTEDEKYFERYRQRTEPAAAPVDSDAGEGPEAPAIAAFLAEAERLIRDRNHRARDIPGYRIQTDDPRLDPDKVVGLIDGLTAFFERVWSPHRELRDLEGTTQVFLFWSFHDYNKLLHDDFSRQLRRPKGHYMSRVDVIAAHTDSDSGGGLANSLVHEVAHQLVDKRLIDPGAAPAIWIEEGLAGYFGFTLQERDGFVAGRIGGKAIQPLGARPDGGEARHQLDTFKRGIRELAGSGTTWIDRLTSIRESNEFYSGPIELHYAASWVLVHYLLHADEGAHAAAFARVLAAEERGAGGPATLYRELGTDGPTLAGAVERHAKRMKAR